MIPWEVFWCGSPTAVTPGLREVNYSRALEEVKRTVRGLIKRANQVPSVEEDCKEKVLLHHQGYIFGFKQVERYKEILQRNQ